MPPSEACVRIIIHVPYDTLHPRTPHPSPSVFPLSAIRPNDGKCRQNDGVLRARGHRNLQACGQTLPRLLWVVTGRGRGARRLQARSSLPSASRRPFQPPAEDARPRAALDSVALLHWRSARARLRRAQRRQETARLPFRRCAGVADMRNTLRWAPWVAIAVALAVLHRSPEVNEALGGTSWWWLAVAAVTVFAIWRDLQSRKGT